MLIYTVAPFFIDEKLSVIVRNLQQISLLWTMPLTQLEFFFPTIIQSMFLGYLCYRGLACINIS